MTNDDAPSIEEIYERATNTSDLKHHAEQRTAADVIRDAAMTPEGLGASLLRLRGQWEAAEKPIRRQPRPVRELLAATVRSYSDAPLEGYTPEERKVIGKFLQRNTHRATEANKRVAELAYVGEKSLLDAQYFRDTAALIASLPELRDVRDAVTIQALKWGMKDAETKATAVIRYWLDQTCGTCDGRKWQLIPGTPGLSNKPCPPPRMGGCGGSGVAPVPHEQEGRRLANHMDQCVHRYKNAAGKRKRSLLEAIPPIDRLSKRAQERYGVRGVNSEED